MDVSKQQPLTALLDSGVCAVIRHVAKEHLLGFIDAIVKGGIQCIEITLNTDDALQMIGTLSERSDVVVGAGTVMTAEGAKSALAAGAKFLVSPHTSDAVLAIGRESGVLTVPGAFTPTEIVRAREAGAELIKVFPAAALGPTYFRQLGGPLGNLPLMATGGVGLKNIGDFVAAGVRVFGIGGSLASKEELANQAFDVIERRAAEYVSAVKDTRL